MKIALDAMGGDYAPAAPVQGAMDAIQESNGDFEIILLGDESAIRNHLPHSVPDRLTTSHTTEIVTMHDLGSKVFKTKPDSSMVRGIQLVKEGTADAFISAGHTGAIMATSLFLLGRSEGVKRPALGAYIPNHTGGKIICDVGANPEAKPQHMLQFAIMASLYLDHIEGIKNPKIGLINIGEEPNKGSELYVETHALLNKELHNFVGNVEGRHIFDTEADVLVCDGFVGNTLLKFAEGWISTFGNLIKAKISEKISYKIGAAFFKPALEDIRSQYDYEEHGGSPLLGVNGISIVAHGSSEAKAIKNSVLMAGKCVRKNLVRDIAQGIAEHIGALG